MKHQPLQWLAIITVLNLLGCRSTPTSVSERPNILWITSEDMNPLIGAYGDELAITPNIDRLASEGVLYRNAFATAPVCSPSRSCLITGVYATSLGTQHLRSEISIPDEIRGFPKYLREAGYYCTNNYKEDYNFVDSTIWDESSDRAHWRNRPEGQPFFSVFNLETTHQSRIFGSDSVYYQRYGHLLTDSERCDPDKVQVPPYHFDTPVVRKLWARYYDQITLMDREVGEILKQLEADGLADNTIIFYYSDHGTGMPRSKRALYDSGLQIPLIIRAPEKWREKLDLPAGSRRDDLVSFVDFAPTMLSLLGLETPEHMQGTAFLGPQKRERKFAFGHADRVDEAYEISRSVRNKKYLYIRNYLPQLPLLQDNFYTDQSEIMQELRRVLAKGELTPAQATMWFPRRSPEELYDVEKDPYQVHNLAGQPAYEEVQAEFRAAQQDWAATTFDSGLLHESDMHRLARGSTIYQMVRDPSVFPIPKVLEVANVVLTDKQDTERTLDQLGANQAVIRFWQTVILHIRGWNDPAIIMALKDRLQDEVASVRLTAAQALCSRGHCEEALPIVWKELNGTDRITRLLAARTFQELGEQAASIQDQVQQLTEERCPQEDWSFYYELYTCWALEEAMKAANSVF